MGIDRGRGDWEECVMEKKEGEGRRNLGREKRREGEVGIKVERGEGMGESKRNGVRAKQITSQLLTLNDLLPYTAMT